MDYKEKLKLAKEALNSGSYDKDTIEYIFPELKESEDEKIRKWLIAQLQIKIGDNATLNNMIYKAIAWLEKQGEQKPIWHNEDEEPKRGSLILLIMQSGTPIVAKIIEPNHTFNHGERWAYIDDLLEQKGKQKDFAPKVELKDYYDIDPHFGKPIDFKAEHFFASKVDGQIHDMTYNTANKIEPKFKNGQWIVWQDKCYQAYYNSCGYELIDQNGLSTSLEYDTIDENARLWTIQDAKKGDVLVYKGSVKNSNGIKYEKICLFNNLNNAFFTLIKVSNYVEECNINVNIDYPDNTIPATKEQCDLLFQKMKEAGYEWHALSRTLLIKL